MVIDMKEVTVNDSDAKTQRNVRWQIALAIGWLIVGVWALVAVNTWVGVAMLILGAAFLISGLRLRGQVPRHA